MIPDVCHELASLIWNWWTGDRIRVSPVEGRLLRLQPGDLLSVAGCDAEVVDRIITTESSLCLVCRLQGRTAELHVPLQSHTKRQTVLWIESDSQYQLDAADVEVWPRSSQRKAIRRDPRYDPTWPRLFIPSNDK